MSILSAIGFNTAPEIFVQWKKFWLWDPWKILKLKIFGEDDPGAQSVKYTKYVVSEVLSSEYKFRSQKYNLGDMSQKWIFFDCQKSAKKADFGVFGTFLSFFQKNVKNFLFSNFIKSYV